MKDKTINLLGPLCLEVNLKVTKPIMLIGDQYLGRNHGVFYGGNLLRKARILKSLGYQVNLWGYIGNDDTGAKIMEQLKVEDLSAHIQKMPHYQTPVLVNLRNNDRQSQVVTEIKNLDLWQARLASMKDPECIILDRSVPVKIQAEIANKYQGTHIFIGRPLDGSLETFKARNPKPILLLSEHDAFELLLEAEKPMIFPHAVFECREMGMFDAAVFARDELIAINDCKEIFRVDIATIRKNFSIVDDYLFAGVVAGYVSKKDKFTSFLWGLAASILNFRRENLDRISISKLAQRFSWKEKNVN